MTHYQASRVVISDESGGSAPVGPQTYEPDIIPDTIGFNGSYGRTTVRTVNSLSGLGLSDAIQALWGAAFAGLGFNEVTGRNYDRTAWAAASLFLEGLAGGLKASVSDVASFITFGLNGIAQTVKSISPPANGRIRFNEQTGAFLAVVKPGADLDGGEIGFSSVCGAFKANVISAGVETSLGLTGVPTRINDEFEPGIDVGIGWSVVTNREMEKYAAASSVFGFGETLEVLKTRNPSAIVANLGIAEQCGGLNFSAWLRANRDLAVYRYYVRITGSADGLPDYDLTGFKSFQFRMKADSTSYLNIVLVHDAAIMAAVADRPNGDLVIDMVATVNGVESLREELIRAPLYSTRYDRGGDSRSISIVGYASGISGGSRVELQGVTTETMLSDGRMRLRCARPDFYLKPGDTAVFGSQEITVGSIASAISPISQYMDVSE